MANAATVPGNIQASAAVEAVLGVADAKAVCEAICAHYTPNTKNPNAPPGERGKGVQRDLDAKGIGKGEQTQYLPSPASTGAKKNPVPGTFQPVLTKARNVARSSTGCGVGNTVRWDRYIDKKWIEFKGDNETYTPGQEKARQQAKDLGLKKQPDATVRPKDCGCPEI